MYIHVDLHVLLVVESSTKNVVRYLAIPPDLAPGCDAPAARAILASLRLAVVGPATNKNDFSPKIPGATSTGK